MRKLPRFEPREHSMPYLSAKLEERLFSDHPSRDLIFGVHDLHDEDSGKKAVELHVHDRVPGNVKSDLDRLAYGLRQDRLISGHDLRYSKDGSYLDKEGVIHRLGRHYRLILHLP